LATHLDKFRHGIEARRRGISVGLGHDAPLEYAVMIPIMPRRKTNPMFNIAHFLKINDSN
jgi:hypothetical protein